MIVTPSSGRPDTARLGQGIATYSEQVEAELARFNADWRRARRRFALCAVLGAILVVSIGVWGFRIETNYRQATVRAAGRLPAGAAVMVVIGPAGGR